MQLCVDVISIMIFVLMAVPFNTEWNSQLLITVNYTSGFLFLLLHFHKFNGGFKYGKISTSILFQVYCKFRGNVYVLEPSPAIWDAWCIFPCLMFLTINNETVTHYLVIICVAVGRANLLCNAVWVYIMYYNNVMWKNVFL